MITYLHTIIINFKIEQKIKNYMNLNKNSSYNNKL